MAGYGTAKVPTTDLNVGFPRAFAFAYAEHGNAKKYYPEAKLEGLDNTVGTDFQASWHEQQKKDAHYMAQAKVKATHAHNARAFSSPHGYYKMPKAVLGQRIFANSALGALYTHSTREDQPSAKAPFIEVQRKSNPYKSRFRINQGVSGVVMKEREDKLTGGVLRTSAGQIYGHKLLEARIGQLNAIDDARGNFLSSGTNETPFAGAQPSIDDQLSSTSLTELANLLQAVAYNLLEMTQGESGQFDLFKDLSKILPLIVKMAVNNSPADIANVLEFIEGGSSRAGIAQLLDDRIRMFMALGGEAEELGGSETAEGGGYRRYAERLTAILEWWNRVVEYLKEMVKIAEAPLKTRKNTSDALLKGLGFAKLGRDMATTYKANVVPDSLFIDGSNHVHNFDNAQRAQSFQARAGSSGAMINPGSSFTRSATTREDSQLGLSKNESDGRQILNDANAVQNAYAYGSGEFQDNTGGRPRAFFGESPIAEYGTQPTNKQVQQSDYEATRQKNKGAMDSAAQQAEQERKANQPQPADNPYKEREEEEAEEGKAEEETKQEIKDITSHKNPATGEYDVKTTSKSTKKYNSAFFSGKNANQLRDMLAELKREHPEIQYTPRGDSKPGVIRAGIKGVLKALGLFDYSYSS